jgi:uncharacterized protein (DUF1800 family)
MAVLRTAAALVALLASSCAAAGDRIFDTSFDGAPEGPHSANEASRFLTQATFGPTLAEIERLRGIGYDAWLVEQLAMAPTLHLPYWDGLRAVEETYQNGRQETWFHHAIVGRDQLRQRVAFALSQIFVVSDRSGAIEGTPDGMAHYYDVLVRNAFGNYRTLLGEVTLHPVMGHYLSMFKNRKPDAALNIRPDENYAREIMQLFSIGLVELNPDGTPKLDAQGRQVPTYTQDTIRGFAHVFTGWNWANCPRTNGGQWYEWEYCPVGPQSNPNAGWRLPMQEWETYHASEGTKQLLNYPGVALANGVLPAGGTARGDLDAALDNVFRHPNVGPFVAKLLIQRLVDSNPSPAYVARVAAKFDDNGSGVRGDLGAVVRAILMDAEARTVAPLAQNRGKLREPLLRVTQLWRALDARAQDSRYREWYIDYDTNQAPLRSPTVFNFYLPGYMLPGELATLGLRSPEFQITTDTFVSRLSNLMARNVYYYYQGNPDLEPETIATHIQRDVPLGLASPRLLVDRYDLLFMGGRMSDFMFERLVEHVSAIDPDDWEGAPRMRVQDALWLILTSPEYVIER